MMGAPQDGGDAGKDVAAQKVSASLPRADGDSTSTVPTKETSFEHGKSGTPEICQSARDQDGGDIREDPPREYAVSLPRGRAQGVPWAVGRQYRGSCEECYPPRREDEVALMRRQRDREYQLELMRQIEERRQQKQQLRMSEIKSDLLRLGRDERLAEYQEQLRREDQEELKRQLRAKQTQDEIEELQQRLHQQQLIPHAHQENGTDRKSSPEPPKTPPSPPSTPQEPDAPVQADVEKHIEVDAKEVVATVKLDNRKPWGHYKLLQRELGRRQQEREAHEAAKEAAERRRAEFEAHGRLERQYKQYLDWKVRAKGRAAVGHEQLSKRLEEGRRWGEEQRKAHLQRRAERNGYLQKWRAAKAALNNEKRAVTLERQKAEAAAAEERKRKADSCFTRWLAEIQHRKLVAASTPLGATGVTTYRASFAAPWVPPTSRKPRPANTR